MPYLRPLVVRKVSQLAKFNKRVTLLSIPFYSSWNSIQNPTSSIYISCGHSAVKYSTKEESLSQTQIQSRSPSRLESAPRKPLEAARAEYELTFTCKSCQTRSTHRISKQGYHYGSVLVACPRCKNRHVISDHLKIFGEKDVSIEDLMREQGQFVKKGTKNGVGAFEILFGKSFELQSTEN